jgi:hypothetical protein
LLLDGAPDTVMQMTVSQRVLFDLLSKDIFAITTADIDFLNSQQLAALFLDTAFLSTAAPFLKEESWLQKSIDDLPQVSFQDFIVEVFKLELAPLIFLQAFLEKSSLEGIRVIEEKALAIEKFVITHIKSKSFSEQKAFAIQALTTMTEMSKIEAKSSMYRTFDRLDELFNLNYSADHGMKKDLKNNERLYEGAGIGVQSSYLTILSVLEQLSPAQDVRFVDLGSGYGRLGFVIGLLRPDMNFKGYEYVKHRVDIATESSENLGLKNHVTFYTQDLASKDFKIPDAEIYYLYDSFSAETYAHVLTQLIEISLRQQIIVATSGNARGWLTDIAKKEGWAEAEEFLDRNFCLFRS